MRGSFLFLSISIRLAAWRHSSVAAGERVTDMNWDLELLMLDGALGGTLVR